MSDDKTIIADPSGMTIFAQPRRNNACFVQYSGTDLGRRYNLDKPEMTIGRAPDSDIVINEQSVSRKHARVHVTNDTIDIEDLNSSNGTFVKDARINSRVALHDGEIIRLGTILFKYFSTTNIDSLTVDKIYRMTNIDAPTQAWNKKYLTEQLQTEFNYSRRSGRDLSVIYFDLDHFKKVNDTYGHAAGDLILKETAGLVKSFIRKDDIFCRFGGEEFVIVLPNTNSKVAQDLAERLRQQIGQHAFKYEGKKIQQTVSLGVSQLNKDMADADALLADADRKLYLSKTNGRNRVTV